MTDISQFELPPLLTIALGYAQPDSRDLFASLFALDTRLASLVGGTSEAMLAQIKLAWWRERLEEPINKRPSGDVVLDSLAVWQGHEQALVELVDAWEILLVEDLSEASLLQFAAGRAAPFAALSRMIGCNDNSQVAENSSKIWAICDLMLHMSEPAERELALSVGESLLPVGAHLPRSMRPLAIMSNLSARCIRRGGAAPLTRRSDALVALRTGIFGR